MKRYFKFTLVLIVALLLSITCFAATPVSKGNATMRLVKDNVNSMVFGKYGEFEKKMIQIDTVNKTIDIKLTARNNQEALENKDAEVVLLLDTSNSMAQRRVVVNNETMTRKELVLRSADQLIDKLLATKENIKLGIVEFATSPDLSQEGTEADAKIITQSLTSDAQTLKSAIETVKQDTMGDRTDVEIGLETAEKLLNTSNNGNANKYVIVLTDAVPNTAKGVKVDLYTKASADPTKAKLQDLEKKGINVISMLINITADDIVISNRPADSTFKTYRDVAYYVFGTPLDPTAGSVYYVTDQQVIDTVTNSIYEELVPVNEYVLTDIVIKDYFPQNIIDNFNFAYLTKPGIGEVTANVDKSDNSITWTISRLKPGEVATFSYRLSLKNTFSSDIVGVNLPTNRNVSIDYKENNVQGNRKNNNKAPIVALSVPQPNNNNIPDNEVPQPGNNNIPDNEIPKDNTTIPDNKIPQLKDNTTPDKELPQTGSSTSIVTGTLIALSLVIAIFSFISYRKNII